jgi:hypothetical protein
MNDQELLRYTVLIYEDELGVWMKIPEFDVQCLTDDPEAGLEVIEEDLRFQLDLRRKKGELVPGRLQRTVLRVGRHEYGPTQVELEERRHLAELEGDQ